MMGSTMIIATRLVRLVSHVRSLGVRLRPWENVATSGDSWSLVWAGIAAVGAEWSSARLAGPG